MYDLHMLCNVGCLVSEFKCDNGDCLHNSYVCNGVDDCGDMSDEMVCGGWYVYRLYNHSKRISYHSLHAVATCRM